MIQWWKDHGTKILGTLFIIHQGFDAIPGLVPPEWKPYYAALGVVLGAFTLNRGFTNTKVQP